MLSRLFVAALWSSAGKGLTSWLLIVMFNCVLSLSHVVSWAGVVLDFMDFWSLPPFSLICFSLQHNSLRSLVKEISNPMKCIVVNPIVSKFVKEMSV